jgi:hypothetical protein
MPLLPPSDFFRRAALFAVGCLAALAPVAAQTTPQETTQQELERLRQRVDALERECATTPEAPTGVDLSGDEYASIRAPTASGAAGAGDASTHPWYEMIRISGYGAFGYYDSGAAGAVPDGSFLVKEASLFIEAQPWEHVTFYSETWITRYLYDGGSTFTIGELYAKFSDLLGTEDGARLGVKVGFIDVPFGEDYLRMDAVDDPLISLTAADPWAIDEGIEVFGRWSSLRWVVAATNGNVALGADDHGSKMWCGKISCDVSPNVYLSASLLKSGKADVSSMWLGQGLITPVGLFAGSSAGASPSSAVSTTMWETDARWSVNDWSIALQGGSAFINDDVNTFDRTLYWASVEPSVAITPALSLHLRYSEIGTDDASQGYLLEGDLFGSGAEFGYDTHRMQRMTGGVRYVANPHVQFKAEVGHDWYDIIAGSTFSTANDSRTFGAIETVVSF